ncbi:hypothetical protein KJ786_01310 [Patescibacteria group bacterium]|nr:hypothetical protein [Patescibacteria group bacterium]
MVSNLKNSILKNFSPEDKNIYLNYALEFFKDVGLKDRDTLIRHLNKLKGVYVKKLLFALAFYQYLEKKIEKNEEIIRAVFLICLIDGVENERCLIDDIKVFFRRLEEKDKLYLLNNLKIYYRKQHRKVYHDLIMKSMYRSFRDIEYEVVDRELKSINKYLDKVAQHFYRVRNFVLHEAMPVTALARIDEKYGLVSVFSGYLYKKNYRNLKSRKRHCNFFSEIEISEFQNIIKRGVINKIKSMKN